MNEGRQALGSVHRSLFLVHRSTNTVDAVDLYAPRYDETTMRALRVETLLREVLPAETTAPAPEDEENEER
jgi:hypothetical protein